MTYERIFIDCSNLYYRAFSTSQNLVAEVDGKRMVTGGVYTSLKMIQRIKTLYLAPEGRIYFLFDNALSGEDRRKDIDPDYKINRKKRDPLFYRGLDYLQMVLSNYEDGYRVCRRTGSEADDLVAPILQSFGQKKYTILFVSNDMDWSRAINDHSHWMIRKEGQDVIFTRDEFFKVYGFYPGFNEICLYKAIRGDVSDNIPPGVLYMPENILLDIIQKVKSVSNLYLYLNDLSIPNKWKDELRSGKGRITLNLQLLDYQSLSLADCRESTVITSFNKKMLIMLYKLLSFKPEVMDDRLRSDDVALKETDFFSDFELYPRAD